jgi:hypothetical protein
VSPCVKLAKLVIEYLGLAEVMSKYVIPSGPAASPAGNALVIVAVGERRGLCCSMHGCRKRTGIVCTP